MKSQAATTAAVSKIDLTWASENQIVWVMLPEDDPSGEACAKGTITKLIDEENIQVQVEGAKEGKNMKGDKVYPLNNYKEYPEGYDDMVEMENLSEAELLNNLRIRFLNDMIYTYVGPTLIVLNPYKRIDKLVSPIMLKDYQRALLKGNFDQKDQAPHVYAISATAMKNMFENLKNQAIVISGESGAGKTENTKSAMKFLTSLGKSDEGQGNPKEENIEDKILACNPVLEAFGNAKTVRNDNSSRFGKYVALLVEKDTRKIIGATITNYLLEKSRVVGQNSEERNYHIFYAFLRGASEETLKSYYLTKDLNDWEFLKNAFQGIVKTVPDDELYKEVTDSFNTMQFSKEEQHAIWAYTAASLMVGNITFDESTFTDNTPCTIKNEVYLQNAAKILNVDYAKLAKSLVYKTRVVGGSAIDSTIKKDECLIFRDSLSKDLFNKLFNWLVRRLNFTVMPPEFTKGGINMTALMNKYYHIGLLDIFGFEIFKVNSIEQFCINFSNEKLQQLYISYVFKGEEKEFINEGLKEYLGELTFKDNQNLIDVLDSGKLPGIFQMIDESCSVNATDLNLYDKIVKTFKKPEFPLTTPKMARDTFIVKHTAKEVEYNINGFRAKNKDEISKTIEDTILGSTVPEMVKIWKNLCLDEVESEESKNAKPNPKDKFLGYKFRAQMKELMDELNSCECHFIRCLKPNEKKQADFFLPQLVLQQIKYMGVLDTIKVRKDSFPVRTLYRSFYEKYQELDPLNSKTPFEKHLEKGSDFTQMSKAICLKKIPQFEKQVLYGNNKMFLRMEAAKEMERVRRDWIMKKIKSAKKIQKAWFKYKHLKLLRAMFVGVKAIQKLFKVSKEYLKFTKLRKKTLQIQGWWRRILFRRKLAKMNKAATKLQAWWKMIFYKKRYAKIKAAAKKINRVMRGAIARKRVGIIKYCRAIVRDIVNRGATELFEKVRIVAAKTIQRYARGYICRKNLSKEIEQIKKAKEDFVRNRVIGTIQRHIRGFVVRSTYKRIKAAAICIQGHMKMRWLSGLFQRLRVVSVKIQRAVRCWLIRREAIREITLTYVSTEGKIYKNLQIAEQANFFGIDNVYKTGRIGGAADLTCNEGLANTSVIPNQTADRSLISEMLGAQSIEGIQYDEDFDYNDFSQTPVLNMTRAVDPYSSKKINLLTKIIDIDLLSDPSLMYDPLWSIQALELQNESIESGTDLQLIEVGQAHTTIIPSTGKLYSFGWNDCFQLGRPTEQDAFVSSCAQINLPVDNFRPKSMVAGDDHNLLLDYQGNLYVWGDNSKGQLGLGHSRETPRITILEFLNNDSIHEIKAKGDNSVVVTQSGKAYYWPLQLASNERIYRPAELCLPPKIQISTAACGYNFAVLIGKNGYVYTLGKDNKAGQLGHGDTKPRDTPTLVETLKNENEIIVSASCGFKHVICKSKLGKVYTWGWGQKGQLGHGGLENEAKPRLLNMSQNASKAKALQVQAGYKHSVVVLDNKKIVWWGSNASLECQASPVEVNVQKKIPNYHKDFIPVKVLCSWSKTMNITYVTMADTRTVELNPALKQKVVSTLTAKMEENCSFNEVDPPFIESIAKHFSQKGMKDRSVKDNKSSKTLPGGKKPVGIQSPTRSNEAGGPPKFSDSLSKLRSSPRGKETISFDTKQSNLNTSQRTNRSIIVPQSANVDSNTSFNSSTQRTDPRNNLSARLSSVSKSPVKNKPRLDESLTEVMEVPKVMPSPSTKAQINKFKKFENETKASPPGKRPAQEVDQLKQLNQKLIGIKKKTQEIMATPMERWTKTDIEFIKMATEPKMLELLQNIKA